MNERPALPLITRPIHFHLPRKNYNFRDVRIRISYEPDMKLLDKGQWLAGRLIITRVPSWVWCGDGDRPCTICPTQWPGGISILWPRYKCVNMLLAWWKMRHIIHTVALISININLVIVPFYLEYCDMFPTAVYVIACGYIILLTVWDTNTITSTLNETQHGFELHFDWNVCRFESFIIGYLREYHILGILTVHCVP